MPADMESQIKTLFDGDVSQSESRMLRLWKYRGETYILLMIKRAMKQTAASSFYRQVVLLPFEPKIYHENMDALICYNFLTEEGLPRNGSLLEWNFTMPSMPVPEPTNGYGIPSPNRRALLAFALEHWRTGGSPLNILAPSGVDGVGFVNYAQQMLRAVYAVLPVAVRARVGFIINPGRRDSGKDIGFCVVPAGTQAAQNACRLEDKNDSTLQNYLRALDEEQKRMLEFFVEKKGQAWAYADMEGGGDVAVFLDVPQDWYMEMYRLVLFDDGNSPFGANMAAVNLPIGRFVAIHSYFSNYSKEKYENDVAQSLEQIDKQRNDPRFEQSCIKFMQEIGQQLIAVGEHYGWTECRGNLWSGYWKIWMEKGRDNKNTTELLNHLENNLEILKLIFPEGEIKEELDDRRKSAIDDELRAAEDIESFVKIIQRQLNKMSSEQVEAAPEGFIRLLKSGNKNGNAQVIGSNAEQLLNILEPGDRRQFVQDLLACLAEKQTTLEDAVTIGLLLLETPDGWAANAAWADWLRPYWAKSVTPDSISYIASLLRQLADKLDEKASGARSNTTVWYSNLAGTETDRQSAGDRLRFAWQNYISEYWQKTQISLEKYFQQMSEENWDDKTHQLKWSYLLKGTSIQEYQKEFERIFKYPLQSAHMKKFHWIDWLKEDLGSINDDNNTFHLENALNNDDDLVDFYDRLKDEECILQVFLGDNYTRRTFLYKNYNVTYDKLRDMRKNIYTSQHGLSAAARAKNYLDKYLLDDKTANKRMIVDECQPTTRKHSVQRIKPHGFLIIAGAAVLSIIIGTVFFLIIFSSQQKSLAPEVAPPGMPPAVEGEWKSSETVSPNQDNIDSESGQDSDGGRNHETGQDGSAGSESGQDGSEGSESGQGGSEGSESGQDGSEGSESDQGSEGLDGRPGD
jgi:hypothetical protein